MKILILGDLHLGKVVSELVSTYRNRVLYFVKSIIEKNNINCIIQLGDFFDDRKNVSIEGYAETKKLLAKYFPPDIKFISICGNHDATFKNTNDLCSTNELALPINIQTILAPSNDEETGFLYLPWINESNFEESERLINESDSNFCFGHLEINGFAKIKGFNETSGLSSKLFNRFKKVFSGHFHLTQDINNISYVGSIFQLDRNDLHDTKRVMILDTDTEEVEEVRIPFTLFDKIVFNSEDDFDNKIVDKMDGKIVDVVFNCKRTLKREKFQDYLYENALNCEMKVIDNSELLQEDVILENDSEQVIDLFKDYLRISEGYDDTRKEALKDLFVEIHNEVGGI